jgi:hypothetical protein
VSDRSRPKDCDDQRRYDSSDNHEKQQPTLPNRMDSYKTHWGASSKLEKSIHVTLERSDSWKRTWTHQACDHANVLSENCHGGLRFWALVSDSGSIFLLNRHETVHFSPRPSFRAIGVELATARRGREGRRARGPAGGPIENALRRYWGLSPLEISGPPAGEWVGLHGISDATFNRP